MKNFKLMDKPELFQFIEMTSDEMVPGFLERCTVENLNEKLQKVREFKDMKVVGVDVYDTGVYRPSLSGPAAFFTEGDSKPLELEVPKFLRVRIEAYVGDGHTANIKVYLPYVWNERYVAMNGGGTASEFPYLWAVNPTSINMTEVYALRNHFAAASTDGSVDSFGMWGFKEGTDEWELHRMLYWSVRGNHELTVIAKAVCEIAYGKEPEYSYIVGTSGGGRQSISAIQLFPEDYDGAIAGYVAVPWIALHISEGWFAFVINNENHKIPIAKLEVMREAVLEKYGCLEKGYIDNDYRPTFDMYSLVGKETPVGPFTEEDARVLTKIYNGPTFTNGKKMRMCAAFNPFIPVWREVFGFGQIHMEEDGTPLWDRLYVVRQVLSWVLRKPDLQLSEITYEDLDWIYTSGEGIFRFFDGQNVDLRDFRDAGGKVIYNMASGDGMVPNITSNEYYAELVKYFGEEELNTFFRFYHTYGGGHTCLMDGVCGEQVHFGEEFKALMLWTEEGIDPEDLPTVVWDSDKHVETYGNPVKRYLIG